MVLGVLGQDVETILRLLQGEVGASDGHLGPLVDQLSIIAAVGLDRLQLFLGQSDFGLSQLDLPYDLP